MALVLPMEIHDSTFGHLLLVYRITLFMEVVNMNVLVLPVLFYSTHWAYLSFVDTC